MEGLLKTSILSAGLQTILTYPLEHIKIQIQINPHSSIRYRSISNLYKGSSILFCTTTLRHIVRWSVYPIVSKYTDNSILKGITIGMCETIVWAPTETIRTNMVNKNINISDGLKDSYQYGFYRGGWATLNKSISKQATRFTIYENMKEKTSFAGVLAGFLSVLVSHPFDLIKTNREVGQNISNIYNRYGILGFYLGIQYRLIIGSITSGISFGVYDFIKKI